MHRSNVPARIDRVTHRHRLTGFTLIEMMVSLAVITVVLGLVGLIFQETTRATRASASQSEAQAWLRQAEQQLRADLADIDLANSTLVLVGRKIPFRQVGLTQDDVAARNGYFLDELGDNYTRDDLLADRPDDGLRADLMMFFRQQAPSQAPPTDVGTGQNDRFNQVLLSGVPAGPVLVAWGHASQVSAADLADEDFSDAVHIQPAGGFSPIPAVDWTLARRATIVPPDPSASTSFSNADWRRIIAGWSDDPDEAGDVAPLDLTTFFANLNAEIDESPYEPRGFVPRQVRDVLYFRGGAGENDRFIAAITPNPRADMASNLALAIAPGCVWFQVEFLMPEDPRNMAAYDTPDASDSDFSRRFDGPVWVPLPSETDQPIVFGPDSTQNRQLVGTAESGRLLRRREQFADVLLRDFPSVQQRIQNIRLWPYAIRVTIKVVDRNGNLGESPLERVIVHRFD
jgi:prepilin-type N-terminal cleavage/methylation domain-containing protein